MGVKRGAEAEGGAGGAGRDGHGSKGRGGGRGCRQGKKAAGWAVRDGGKGHGDGRQDGTAEQSYSRHWAEAHQKIARMTLTIKLDRNWSSFQLANSAPPLSVTGSAIAPSARMTLPDAAAHVEQHCWCGSLAVGAARCCGEGGRWNTAFLRILGDDRQAGFHGHGVARHAPGGHILQD